MGVSGSAAEGGAARSDVRPPTAFVLAGGGSLGAVQVGMLYALIEAGIRPDMVFGSSVGALNGAHLAGNSTLEGVRALAELWRGLRRRDIFPVSPVGLSLALAGRRDHLVDPLGLRTWILRAGLGFERIEEASLPLRVVATDVESGSAVVLSEGDAVEALMASTAMPGIFPPVEVEGRLLMDGGVAADAPVMQAVQAGARSVYLLPTTDGEEVGRPHGVVEMVFRAMSVMSRKASADAVAEAAGLTELYVVPPPPTSQGSGFDFSSSAALVDDAYELASSWVGAAEPLAGRGAGEDLAVGA